MSLLPWRKSKEGCLDPRVPGCQMPVFANRRGQSRFWQAYRVGHDLHLSREFSPAEVCECAERPTEGHDTDQKEPPYSS